MKTPKPTLPSPTSDQAKVTEHLQRIQLGRYVFWIFISLFLVVLLLIVSMPVLGWGTCQATYVFGLLEVVLGWGLKTIVAYLFPDPRK